MDQELSSQHAYLISGHNGSGKSTLLKLLTGYISPNEGKITWQKDQQEVPIEQWPELLAVCTPYLELIEEFTLQEMLDYHQKIKPLNQVYTAQSFAQKIELDFEPDKAIRYFSSGMKQRVKLGLVFFSGCEVILLDEPVSNLDKCGIQWYKNQIEQLNTENRLIVVCSNNQEEESFFCDYEIRIEDYFHQPRKT